MSVSFCLFLSNFSEMAPFYGTEDLRDDSLWSADGSRQNLFDSSNKISYLYKTRLKVLELAKLTIHAYGLSMVA